MKTSVTLLTCCLLYGLTTQDQSTQKALVAKKADEVGKAMVKGDYATVLDLTYPKAIEHLGGRDKAMASMQQEMKKIEEQGFRLSAVTTGEPGEFVTSEKLTFVVVPTQIIITIPGGKFVSKGYLLGISSDPGKTWHFVDSAGINNAEARAQIIPKLPDQLKLPIVGAPEFIMNKK